MEHFFHRIHVDTYAQMHTSVKLFEGNADVNHNQTMGGIQSNYWRDISLQSPPGFGTTEYGQKISGFRKATLENLKCRKLFSP